MQCPNGCAVMEPINNQHGWKGWICNVCNSWLRDKDSLPAKCGSTVEGYEYDNFTFACELEKEHKGKHKVTIEW